MTKSILPLCLGFVAAVLVGGCASKSPASAISKVQMFHLKNVHGVATREPMIQSETRGRLWGAITTQERLARVGNYYKVHWKTDDKVTPATVKFQYRQANTGSTLHSQEVTLPAPVGSNITEFQVVGEPYKKDGRVVSWRISVEQGGRVVGEETSFLWN